MKVIINDQGAHRYAANKSPTFGQSLISMISGNPSTMTKLVKAVAEFVMFSDPQNISARNTFKLAGDAKNLLSLYEVIALGSRAVDNLIKSILPSSTPDPLTGKSEADFRKLNALGAAQMSSLAIGEGVASYAYLMKANIVFIGDAARVASYKFYSEAILGVGAVLSAVKTGIELRNDFNTYYAWNLSGNTDRADNFAIAGDKTDQEDARQIEREKSLYKLESTASEALKTMAYLGFGAITLTSIVAPAVIVSAEAVYLLTVATIVFTITKHFAEEEIKKLDCQMEQIFIRVDGIGKIVNMGNLGGNFGGDDLLKV